LAEFPDVAPLAADAIGLANLRSDLVDEWLEARLAGPSDPDLVADASRAARAAPQRERTAIIRMRALAREGRSAEPGRRTTCAGHCGADRSRPEPFARPSGRGRSSCDAHPAPAARDQQRLTATPFVGRHRAACSP
jgi:hypothetical protein